ncbi:MAG: hypothetical protein ABI707_14175 [Ferruginibacter sp.]
MSQKKHIPFNYRQIGVFIFLYLNCFLTAAPFFNASAENNNFSELHGYLSQNHNLVDPEDNSRFNYSDAQQQYHITARSKQHVTYHSRTPANYSFLSNTVDEKGPDLCFASSSFLVRPAYYIFLSLYKLF